MSRARTAKLIREGPRNGVVCELCFFEEALQLHHRWKAGQGGPWSCSNCIAVGVMCHHRIEHDVPWAKSFGWWLYPTQHPATAPCRLARHGWVLLNDDGTFTPTVPPVAAIHPADSMSEPSRPGTQREDD